MKGSYLFLCICISMSASTFADDSLFKPIQIHENNVSINHKNYMMNEFGLWNNVIDSGKKLLAAPMSFQAIDSSGKSLKWQGQIKLTSQSKSKVCFNSECYCDAMRLKVVSEIEDDGVMKVTVNILPIENAIAIKRLSLLIPIKEKIATQFHECTGSKFYAGSLPKVGGLFNADKANGEIWSSLEAPRPLSWLSPFVNYLWLGNQYGIAWFAENDKGWLRSNKYSEIYDYRNEKLVPVKYFDTPLMKIYRKNKQILLRVDVVSIPGKIASETNFTFGLQTTPVFPDQKNFSSIKIQVPEPKISTNIWGTFSNNPKQWEIVDKAVQARSSGKFDTAFFESLSPKLFTVNKKDIIEFASEHKAMDQPDYAFLYNLSPPPGQSKTIMSAINSWFKRGISIYIDNMTPQLSYDTKTSAAYNIDNQIQAAMLIWEQRRFLKQVWQQMNYWKCKGVARPLELASHFKSNRMPCLFPWVNYYNATSVITDNPAPPLGGSLSKALLEKAIDEEVGAFPYFNTPELKIPKTALGIAPEKIEILRREWAMRLTDAALPSSNKGFHELPFSRNIQNTFYLKGTNLFYSGENHAAITINTSLVNGMLISYKYQKSLILILQSMTYKPVNAVVTIHPDKLEFPPKSQAYNAFRNQYSHLSDNTLTVNLELPYETAYFLIDTFESSQDILFRDSFGKFISPGWDHASSGTHISKGALCFSDSDLTMERFPFLLKWLNIPDFSNASLSFKFRIDKEPAAKQTIFTINFPFDSTAWQQKSLLPPRFPKTSFKSEPNNGLLFKLGSSKTGQWSWSAYAVNKDSNSQLANKQQGTVDNRFHDINITCKDNAITLFMDGKEFLTFPYKQTNGNAFQFTVYNKPDRRFGKFYIDDIQLKSDSVSYKRINKAYSDAKASAAAYLEQVLNSLKEKE